ncbi:hypothetical protein [Helicobacter canis]|uniref:hypothetical protein n=1 Tax=Helicobacter canis TaxID=29419 RepID=UPI0015F04104|nr:hypothetical protein [Helicobacter canis]
MQNEDSSSTTLIVIASLALRCLFLSSRASVTSVAIHTRIHFLHSAFSSSQTA